jgi:ADP-ribose pyrophosphatase
MQAGVGDVDRETVRRYLRRPVPNGVPKWKHRPSRLVYHLGRFGVVEDRWDLPDGTHLVTPLIKSPSFAVVVAVTENREVVLVRNLHPSPGLHLLELPGGRLEPGEGPRAGARRELEEETGWRASTLTPIGRYFPNPHWGTFQGHVFLGTGLRQVAPHPDPGESVRPVLADVGEVYRRLHRGRFFAGSTLVGLFLAEDRLRTLGVLGAG